MEQYKQEFINFMVESEVLKFGEFTLKSGCKSPFFMNAGAYVTGTQLRRLGSITQRRFATTMVWISMSCLDRLTRNPAGSCHLDGDQ